MANPNYQTITGTGNSVPIVVDWLQVPFSLSATVEAQGGVTFSATVQYTVDDVNDPTWTPVWINQGSAVTANGTTTFGDGAAGPGPIRALRLNVSALTGGNLRFAVLQGINQRAG